MSVYSKNIVFLRRSRRVTQAQLASAASVSQSTIINWENEKTEPIISQLIAVAQYFDIPVQDLVFVELEKGDLISKTGGDLDKEKGDLKGDPKGDLNESKVLYARPENQIIEGIIPHNNPILDELRRIAENTEQTRVLLQQMAQDKHKKSAG